MSDLREKAEADKERVRDCLSVAGFHGTGLSLDDWNWFSNFVLTLLDERDALAARVEELEGALHTANEDRIGLCDEMKRMRKEYGELSCLYDGIAPEAMKWRALVSSDRIRIMGRTMNMNHIGVEFWRNHESSHPSEDYPQDYCREVLDAFASGAAEAPTPKADK